MLQIRYVNKLDTHIFLLVSTTIESRIPRMLATIITAMDTAKGTKEPNAKIRNMPDNMLRACVAVLNEFMFAIRNNRTEEHTAALLICFPAPNS